MFLVVNDFVEGSAGAHGTVGEFVVRLKVASYVHGGSLALDEFVNNLIFRSFELLCELLEGRVVSSHGLGPVQGHVEGRAAVVEFLHLAGRGLVVVQHLTDGVIKALGELLRLGVILNAGEVLQRDCERKVLTQTVPAEVALLVELLDVLGGGPTGARLEEAAALEERDDGEHLGRGAELDDGEQVGEVVTQNVARGGDDVLALADVGAAPGHSVLRSTDGNVQTLGVVVLEVLLHLADEDGVVSAGLVEPEGHGVAGEARALHGEAHPVADGVVLGLAHAPDVALADGVLEDHVARVRVHDTDGPGAGDLEGLVVGAVLLSLLGHETHVADASHGGVVELPVRTAVIHHGLVHTGVGTVRDDCHDLLEGVVLVPHLATVAHQRGHGGVDDYVVGDVQVGDTLGRVHHREPRAGLVRRFDVRLDLVPQRGVLQAGDPRVQVREAVVGVDAELLKGGAVLGEHVLEKHLDGVAEDNGVGDLHHRRLEVERRHDALLLAARELGLEEVPQGLGAHAGGVDHFALHQGGSVLEDRFLARFVHVHDAHLAVLVEGGGLLAAKEVVTGHARDARTGVLAPLAHPHRRAGALGVLLHRGRHPPVGVTLAQHGVHCTPEHLGVGRRHLLLLLRLGLGDVVRHVVALRLQLRNRVLELGHGRADIR
mmetsp:Transcript_2304/g.6413  ORF Transcript_2304/g.6413 Transcript_2304/m.6413 type:complete len:658 (-) Transcript_2304:455-2428(-)